ncbi:MAG: peptidylprolyl isomerase [Clostridia bacterium]|nr:peptidylprolyl isomerase [Clostridia bacterium]
MSKKIKKMCLALGLAAVVGVSAGACACTVKSKHPTVRITISFNQEEYEIDYTLYRNMYPQTVQHFIELVDAGFYDNTIIHDYKSSDWVGGEYWYDDSETSGYVSSNGRNAMGEYFENHSKEKDYYDLVNEGIKNGDFTASVFKKTTFDKKGKEIVEAQDALSTLIGEFSENGHKIADNKGLTATYGTLKMVYYKKDIQPIFVKNSFDQILPRDYNYNCATSLFSLQMKDGSTYTADKYAVFGQLKNDKARNKLEDLTDAVSDYATTLGSTNKLTTPVNVKVETEDKFADEGGKDIETSFTVISMPIIIVKMEVTKY